MIYLPSHESGLQVLENDTSLLVNQHRHFQMVYFADGTPTLVTADWQDNLSAAEIKELVSDGEGYEYGDDWEDWE